MTAFVQWFDNLNHVAVAIVAATAATAALWKPLKKLTAKVLGPRRAKLARIQAYRERQDEMHRAVLDLADDMREVKAEVKPNGGTSLNDKVTALGFQVGLVDAARRVGDHRALWERRVTRDGFLATNHLTTEWTRLTGISREGMDNGGWTSCISPVDRNRVIAAHNLAMEDSVLFQAEYVVINKLTGALITVAHEDTPVFVGAQLIGWISYLHEVAMPARASA